MLPVTTVDSHHLFIPPRLSSRQTLRTATATTTTNITRVVSLRCAAILKEEAPLLLGFLDGRKRNVSVRDSVVEFGVGKFVRRCSQDWGSEGGDYSALEAEILEFMKSSEDPEGFPSKKELIDAGRSDIVEGIVRKGGWMASGWDSEEDESQGDEVLDWKIQTESTNLILEENESQEVLPESAAEDDSGIEGLLSRLKRERNLKLGIKLAKRGEGTHPAYEEPCTASKYSTLADIKRNSEPASVDHNNGKTSHLSQLTCVGGLEKSLKPDDWRTWSAQRGASALEHFEGCEIISEESRTEEVDGLGSEALQTVEGKKTGIFEAGLSTIRIRLRQMESELSTVLHELKSASNGAVSHKASESSCDDQASESSCDEELLKLYDDLEFRETEIMRHKDKLRSTRAKLAIEEGRMALRTIDAQRLEEEKRKSGSSAYKALQLLSTAYLVWTNNATEVLVTGSFDGWATKRKMNKSKTTGIFSLYMKLYPGKYEIKFIVDGEWKVDLLRPTVEYKGYVNNVLIVH